jgi:hypothetical protein
MRRRTFILSLLALVGCRSKKTSSGDFAQFFVSEVRGRGGRTLEVDQLPVIEGSWRVERDEFGFQVHLFGVEFESVDSFMTRVLGEPEISVPKNTDGYPQRMYDRKVSGMHIQLIGEKDDIFVVAVGPKKN